MASRLNHLFQNAPQQFLEHTVLFADGLTSPESTAQMRHRMTHCIDLEPTRHHLQARARVLAAQHLYQDTPLVSYFVALAGVTLIPREDPPHQFVFLPEFTRCRLLVSADGDNGLKLQLEQNLSGKMPPPDPKRYLDAFAYWDHMEGELVGVIRGTAVLHKLAGQPWTITMQQIVGTAGHELVRQSTTRELNL